MSKQYVPAEKIEADKTYQWDRDENERYRGGDVIALEELFDYWIFRYADEAKEEVGSEYKATFLHKRKSELNKLILEQKILQLNW